jgi:Family of unknown function (DUF6152)
MIAAIFIVTLPTAAAAHHSAATVYDVSRTAIIEGSITEVVWINPHVEIEMLGDDQARWRLETRPPGFFSRQGISKSDLEAFVGQKATVKLSPARDGSRRGWLLSATFQDGAALTLPAD